MALNFDGTDDFVDMGTPAALDITAAISLVVWVFPTANGQSNGSRIHSKRDTSGGTDVYAIFQHSSNVMRFRIVSGAAATVLGTTAIPLNAWSFIVGTYDGANLRLYIDSVQDAVLAKTGAIDTSTIAFHLGDRTGEATDRRWQGRMDDVRIYDRALSVAEIETIFAAKGVDGIVDGMVARWLMNEDAPGVVASGADLHKDLGKNGIDGTPNNSPTFAESILRSRRRVA